MAQNRDPGQGPSRRTLLTGALGAAATLPMGREAVAQQPPSTIKSATHEFKLKINGQDRNVALDVRTTLLDTLRDHLSLTGAKKGCDHGQCGACTVLVDGRRVLGCLTLAASVKGRSITTIEGLGSEEQLHPMQSAFVEHDAFQCGYCTPGQILSAVGCVAEGHARSDAEIREYMSGNLCRCAAYPNIVAAVRDGASKMRA